MLNMLEVNFVTKKDLSTRDGLIPKGTNAYICEISENEKSLDGENTPYKVLFDYEVKIESFGETTNASDWLSEQELNSIM